LKYEILWLRNNKIIVTLPKTTVQCISIRCRLDSGIPFGDSVFTSIRTTSNGFISLGISQTQVSSLYRPFGTVFSMSGLAILAPFWDDFQPNLANEGRVYYQVLIEL